MATLLVESWNDERRWAGENSWPLRAFCDRLQMCTNLHGVELKRVAKKLKRGELMSIEGVDKSKASALVHTLESLGAIVVVE